MCINSDEEGRGFEPRRSLYRIRYLLQRPTSIEKRRLASVRKKMKRNWKRQTSSTTSLKKKTTNNAIETRQEVVRTNLLRLELEPSTSINAIY